MYSIPQTARLLFGDPPKPKKVWRMVAAHEIPSVRVGGKTYIPRVELEAWLAQLPSVSANEAITNLGQRALIAGLRAERTEVA
jgi:excisionase family DNA binding protein